MKYVCFSTHGMRIDQNELRQVDADVGLPKVLPEMLKKIEGSLWGDSSMQW